MLLFEFKYEQREFQFIVYQFNYIPVDRCETSV